MDSNTTTTSNETTTTTAYCSLKLRVYSPDYLFFKLLNFTYLRGLAGPGLLLNLLCLFVLSRPRLSGRSTTIVFLRFLAVFDILAILMKYIRAELNYQSIEKQREFPFLVPAICKIIYIFLNAFVSMSMWTIVLMSIDKAVAVSYPLKASIWLTQRRVFYICCITSWILFFANLSFINISGILISRNHQKYCGLIKDSLLIDVLTASILPIGLITGANIIIAVVLRRVSRKSFNWSESEEKSAIQEGESTQLNHHLSFRTSYARVDPSQTNKRRTSAQVTRMLLAVTLSLIIFNIPNTIIFLFSKIYDTRQLLFGRSCSEVSDGDIRLYKLGFYSSVLQDILSDLPHIVNFFLYCLAGKKFRSIFFKEVEQFLLELHLIKRKAKNPQRTNNTGTLRLDPINHSTRLDNRMQYGSTRMMRVTCTGSTNQILLNSSRQSDPNNRTNFVGLDI